MDPYIDKLQRQDLVTKERLEEYMANSNQSSLLKSETTLTYLVIATNLWFTDDQYRFMLGLQSQFKEIYQGLIVHIKMIANEIYRFFKFKSLLQIPLTNLKDISYQIGLNFKQVFFVPVKVALHDNSIWVGTDSKHPQYVIKFISKYKEMWIISSILNREYQRMSRLRVLNEMIERRKRND